MGYGLWVKADRTNGLRRGWVAAESPFPLNLFSPTRTYLYESRTKAKRFGNLREAEEYAVFVAAQEPSFIGRVRVRKLAT